MKINILNETINYVMEDTGKPKALFIHGFTSNIKQIVNPILSKERNFDIVAIDLPCHGESTCVTPSLKNMFDVTNTFIELMKFENLIVVGHSMGGPVALSTLGSPRVKHAILMAPLNHNIDFRQDIVSALLPKTIEGAINTIQNLVAQKQSSQGIKMRAFEFFKNISRNYTALEKIAINEIMNESFHEQYIQPLYTNDNNYELIGGTADNFIPIKTLQEISKDEGVKLHKVKNIGHVPIVEANQLVLDIITKAVDK